MKRNIIAMAFVAVIIIPVSSHADQSRAQDGDNETIALVLGKKITVKDKDKLNGMIFGALLEQYAKENKIEPTEAELDAFMKKTGLSNNTFNLTRD